MKKEWRVQSIRETEEVAREIAAELHPGDLVGLIGPLGAGKTTFVQGITGALGVNLELDAVVSPTFVIFNIYSSGRVPIYHFDLYRLKSKEELQEIGYEEFWWGEGITLVEWFDQIEFPEVKTVKLVQIEPLSDGTRLIQWKTPN